MVATRVLWALSGRRFGFCSTTVRPCDDVAVCTAGYASMTSAFLGGTWLGPWVSPVWRSSICGFCGPSGCSCDEPTNLRLWHAPIESVESVTIDGVALDETSYRVDDWSCLTRTDGGVWPSTQNLLAESDQDDTFEIEYRYGHPVPPEGELAAGVLTCELVKLQLPNTSCSLPQRVTSITRQGVSVALLDPMDFLDKGRTGLYLVDLFLASVNPGRAKRAPGIFRADDPSHRGSAHVGTWRYTAPSP